MAVSPFSVAVPPFFVKVLPFSVIIPLVVCDNEAGTMTGEVHAYRLAVLLYKVESLLVCISRLIPCGLSCLPKVLA